MSQLMKKRFPSITSIDVQSDGNTSFLRAARNGQLDKVLEHLKSNIDINTSNANGLNALHLASKDGHVGIVEELLKRGAVVDAATKKGNTALHIASLAGQEEVVKLLVEHDASVNVQSQNGFTPLYMAAQENHDNVVKYLLANGANQSLSTEDGFTPLAVAMQQGHDKVVTVLLENDTRGKVRLPALHIAAKKDDVKAAKLLLENEHNPDVTSKSGFTPLHIASHYGNQQIANLLIQKGADVNYAAKHNITPLHVAAKWGKSNMVALLLEHGATIEAKTRDGLTPLHCAARSGHEQVVDMLLERGAPISSKTKNGLAPLHMAAQGDHIDAARILLYHRAPVDEVTVDYLTALHVAAHCGHVRVAKLLLDRQADANARALNGFTPLHIACKKNRIKVVELLLKHGASIGATTESGLTPLHVASFMGCMNIVIYLLQHDANPDVPTVRGETPLHLAARANQTDIIRILLRNGAQVDARAREQQTPLHIASRLGNVDIVMLLLQHGAKVDNTTKDMYTALHIASKEGQDEVAAVLLDNGASLDATTKKGFTPLHLAAKYGHLKVAKLLLQKEAPVDAQGKNGVTPLHVASHYDHQNVALLLLDKGASPHATAKNGHTPLHIAARKNQMDIANTLLEYGAQPNAESKAGFTPLHLSAQEGHAEMTALLLEHKANANHEAKNGLAPLHLCAQEDRVPVAEVLVKNGAEVNASTKGGYTPLHIASHYGQTNMVKFLLQKGADIESKTSLNYTPLHQAAQQGHANIVNILLENNADPNATTTNGQTPLNIAQKLGYITVIETLKVVTTVTTITTTTTTNIEEKYRVQAPELMHETFMSDSEEEGGEDTVLGDQTYRYLTADEMKSLGDDSLPIDVTRDERIDSNRMVSSGDSNILAPHHIEDNISPEHVTQNYVEYIKKYSSDNVDISRHPVNIGFLVSFLVDARGGAMRGCRHSGVRVIVPPRCAPSPTRITCRYVRPQRTPHPPPLMEGEALASRVLELGPVGAKFLGPVIIEVPHFAALRGKEREIVILRSDNGESWKEHTVEASEEILSEVLNDSFEAEDLNQLEDVSSGRITRILTQDFPQYFAVVSRVRQEVHAIGPEGGMVSSTVVPQVQAVFPEGALTKKIKVGLQAQPIDPELTAKLLGHGVAVSPVVTVEPRRRKFHKAITLSMPAPRAHSQGMINQYSGSAPTLRLLCSITGGTTRAQWEDVTGSTPLTFVNDCVSFTTTVSARFWLMDCRNIGDATKMATELYKEAIHVPFMAKFVVFAKRVDPLEARLRVFCMTDDKEDKTLEHQEHFTEVAKSRDVEVLEGKQQYIEFAGNLVPITKSGEQLSFSFRAFRENRLPFSVRVKDQHAEAVSRCLFMKEPKVPKGEPPQQPICILNIVLPDDIVTDTISLNDSDSLRKYTFLSENFDYYRPDPRIADMSNLLGEDWVSLANQLGLTSSEINVIKSEYPDSIAKQAQSMLRMWLSQSGNKAQTNTLENALRRIGREDIIPQCLNVDNAGSTITRIKHEEIGRYRLKKDIDSIDNDAVKDEVGQKIKVDRQEAKTKFDKYSAEEKAIEKSDEEEEESFDKPVAERREQIQKRLSAERTIPASSQRREIVQEITTIKEQNLVEDKIAEVQQKVKTTGEHTKITSTKTITTDEKSFTPDTKTVSRTIELKTTLQPESNAFDTASHERVQEHKITTSEETRTNKTDIHKTTEDSELLEGVTQSFEKKIVISNLIAERDPTSPRFAKTPPPSPADFLLREQAATVQEWEATRQTLDLEPKAPTVEEDASQKGKTTVFHTEDNLIDRSFVNRKIIHDQTNALIQSESRAEPYHSHTQKYYKIEKHEDQREEPSQSARTKPKKRKKNILGTIKNFVGKSFDSDSESEKASTKKEKMKYKKGIFESEIPQAPVPPTRKLRLSTPPEDSKYADIPFFESSPTDVPEKSFEVQNIEQTAIKPVQETYISSITIPITDLDGPDSGPKEQTKQIVVNPISDAEKSAKEKSKKQKVVILNEQVTKSFSPRAVDEEEFTIVIDPSKRVSPKKTRETFTFNIDESIGEIEKEILGKSPILSEEKLMKPLVKLEEEPTTQSRFKSYIYEDIGVTEIPSYPDHSVSQAGDFHSSSDLKKITQCMIENEITYLGWADDESNVHNRRKQQAGDEISVEAERKTTETQKVKRKHGKLFGIFNKASKDVEDSEEDSKKEIIEKQDSETSKEMKGNLKGSHITCVSEKKKTDDVLKSPKLKKSKEDKGILSLFKKDKTEVRPAFSDAVIKDMIDSTSFLKEEIDKYHDVRKIYVEPSIKVTDEISSQTDKKSTTHEATSAEHKSLQSTTSVEDEPIEYKFKETVSERRKNEAELSDAFVRPTLDQLSLRDVEESDKFLRGEIEKYHDVRPLTKVFKTTEVITVTTVENEKETPRKMNKPESDGKKSMFFDIFKKKEPQKTKTKSEINDVSAEPTQSELPIKKIQENDVFLKDDIETQSTIGENKLSLIDMGDSDTFLRDEIERYHDVRPIVKKPTIEADIVTSVRYGVESPEKLPEVKGDEKKGIKISEVKIESTDISVRPIPTELALQNMKDCGTFLKDEVENYHDVLPVLEDTQSSERIEITSVENQKKDLLREQKPTESKEKKTSLFSIFRKKGSNENKVEATETETVGSTLTELNLENMQKTSNFIEDEIEKYHDVRPVITNIQTSGEKLDQREYSSEMPKVVVDNDVKAGSEQEIAVIRNIDVSVEPTICNELTFENMKDSRTFLEDEIDKYHDVRPIIQKSQIIKDKVLLSVETENTFSKKSDEPKDGGKKSAFFKTKSSGGKDSKATVLSEKPTVSELTLKNIEDCSTFLKDEVLKYHDVMPVLKDPQNQEQMKITSVETQSHSSKNPAAIESDTNKKSIFEMFKKKDSTENKIDIAPVDTSVRATLSEPILEIMQDTGTFIKREIDIYHDVRPVIIQTNKEKVVIPVESYKKDLAEKLKTRKNDDTKGTVFSSDTSDRKADDPIDTILSELTLKNIEESHTFLGAEIEKYHDVRPIIKKIESIGEKTVTSMENEQQSSKGSGIVGDKLKSEKGTLFNIFKKKGPEAGKTDVSVTIQPPLSEVTLKNINDSNTFLKDEVEKYHDVRPVIIKPECIEEWRVTSEQTLKNAPEVPETVEGDKKKVALFKVFQKNVSDERKTEVESTEVSIRPTLSELTLQNMRDCDTFLKDEVEKYHDVKPVLRDLQSQEQIKITPVETQKKDSPKKRTTTGSDDKKSSIFNVFKKKGSEERKVGKIDTTVKPALSEPTLKNMEASDTFPKGEIEKYHDVRLVIEKRQPGEETQGRKMDSPKKSKTKVTDDDKGIIFNILKKKGPEERKIDLNVPIQPLLSEITFKNMNDSNTFLKDEVEKYHDVRPIIKKLETIEERIVTSIQTQSNAPEEQGGVENDEKILPQVMQKNVSTERKTEVESTEVSVKPTLSELTLQNIRDCDTFLQDEVEKYHDVLPVLRDPQRQEQIKIAPVETQKMDSVKKRTTTESDEKKSSIFNIFKKKGSEERKVEAIDTSVKSELSETTLKNMKESDTFLNGEIEKYHDVRPVIKKTQPSEGTQETQGRKMDSPEKYKTKVTDDKKSKLFNIFKKKGSEERKTEVNVSIQPPLSELMNVSNTFLKDEVEKYHDVRPIIKKPVIIEERIVSSVPTKSIAPEEQEKVESEKGSTIFKVFQKNASAERKTEIEVTEVSARPTLSELTLQNMRDSDTFLKDEVEKYHDVKPVLRDPQHQEQIKITVAETQKKDSSKEPTIIASDDKKSSLFNVFKKKGSEERKVERIDTTVKSVLSEPTLKNMEESDTFLKGEKEKYHDVRPVITITQPSEETQGRKMDSPKKTRTKVTDDKKGKLFNIFKKKGSEERKTDVNVSIQPPLSELMNVSNTFLKDEVEKYQDVRPIIKKPVIIEERIVSSVPTKSIAPEEQERVESEKESTIFKVFQKNASAERKTEIEVTEVSATPTRSEPTLQNMRDCDTFLKDEVEKYHDVKPVLREPQHQEQIKITPVEAQRTDSPKKLTTGSDEKKSSIFNIFKKKGLEQRKVGAIDTSVKPALSETTLKNMKESDTFLIGEIEKYHDVRPVTKKTQPSEEKGGRRIDSPKKSKTKVIDDKKGVSFNIFKKKGSEERNTDEGKIDASIQPKISDVTLKNMNDGDTFLNNEVEKYHDVRPIIKEPETIEERRITSVQTQSNAPEETERVEGDGKKGALFKVFQKDVSTGKKTKVEATEDLVRPTLSDLTLQNMRDCGTFLKDEVEKYHDVKPVLRDPQRREQMKVTPAETQKNDSSKGPTTIVSDDNKGSLFNIFKKKGSEERIVERIDTTVKSVLSEPTLKNMEESDTFLKGEIEKYHDVRPVIIKIQPSEEIQGRKMDSPKKSRTKVTDDKIGKLFNIFKKKGSEERKTDVNVSIQPTLSELMNVSNTFLKDEVEKYHDVRPIIKKPLIIEERIVPSVPTKSIAPEEQKRVEEEKRSTIFKVFQKNASAERKTEIEVTEVSARPTLSELTLQNMRDCDTFLKDEVEKYHDVKLVLRDPQHQKQMKITVAETRKKDSSKGPTIIASDDKKSSLFNVFKKKGSEERKVERIDTTIKSVLSEPTLKNMEESDKFLKGEIEKYHDVRPVIIKIQPSEEIQGRKMDSPKKSRTKVTDDKKGKLFNIFKKKGSEERKTDVTVSIQPPLSELMNVSNTFLKDEVEKYHDVRPIIKKPVIIEERVVLSVTNKSIAPQKQKRVEDEKRSTMFKVSQKNASAERKTEIEVIEVSATPTRSELTLQNMRDCDTFLKDEVEKYHDVKPVLREPQHQEQIKITPVETQRTDSPKKPRTGSDEKKSSIFNIFKKKGSEQSKVGAIDTSVKPALSETTLKNMKESDTFLIGEIEKYHDVRPVTKKTQPSEEKGGRRIDSPKKSKTKVIDDKKGVSFNIFKKKGSEERNTDEGKINASIQPKISDVTLKNMNDSDIFLNNEVEKYHDVRPIIKEPETIEERRITSVQTQSNAPEETERVEGDGKKGALFKVFQKDVSTGKKTKVEATEDLVRPTLSELTLQNMRDCGTFLKDEVEKYHDVKPVLRDPQRREQMKVTAAETQKNDSSKGPTTIVSDDNKSSLFNIFKKKGSEERKVEKIHTSMKPALSEPTLKNMEESDAFLKGEIEKYHDVRPVIEKTQPSEEKEGRKMDSPKKSKTKVTDDKKGTLFNIFRKKGSEERKTDVGKIDVSIQLPLSELTLKNMDDSNTFLKAEVEKYHDVRFIIKKPEAVEKKKVTSEQTQKKTLKEPERSEGVKKEGVLFKLSQKNVSAEERMKVKATEALIRPTLSELTLQNMRDCDTFLKDEVEKYYDVKPVLRDPQSQESIRITAVETQKMDSSEEPTVKASNEKRSPLFKIFKKKGSEGRKIKVEAEMKPLSELTLKNMQESDTFIEDEIEKYHDVRPIIQKYPTIEEKTAESLETMKESPEESVKVEGKRSVLSDIFKKKESEGKKTKVEATDVTPTLNELTLQNMRDCDTFLKDEVANYHDVLPVLRDTQNNQQIKVETQKMASSGGPELIGRVEKESSFFKLFKKKGSVERKVEAIDTFVEPTLSEQTLQNMQGSNAFIRGEIERYHDVRPVNENIQTNKEKEFTPIEVHRKSSPKKSNAKVVDEKKGTLFSIFKKKSSEERKTDLTKPSLNELTLKYMKESHTFLMDEIERYHDVRPIIKKPLNINEKTEEAVKQSSKDLGSVEGDRKESTPIELFKKKGSKENKTALEATEVVLRPTLSVITLKNMKDSNNFLKDEVEKYHDVRPVLNVTQAKKEITTTPEQMRKIDSPKKLKTIENDRKKSSLFNVFKKKAPKEEITEAGVSDTSVRSTLSELTLKNMQESDTFLKDEIEKYHDVRPIIRNIEEKEITPMEGFEVESPKKTKAAVGDELADSEERKTIDGTFNATVEPMLSEATLKNMKDSHTLLKNEIDKYHDVRLVINKHQIIEKKEETTLSAEKEESEKLETSPLDTKNKYSDGKEAIVPVESEPNDRTHKKESKGSLFNIFKKKVSVERKTDIEATPVPIRLTLSGITLKNLKDTDTFLKDEIEKYHDVRPVHIEQSSIKEKKMKIENKKSPKKSKTVEIDEKKSIFDIFRKKGSQGRKPGVEGTDASLTPALSEITLNNMKDSDNFLKGEIEIYHDVRPVIKETSNKKEETESTVETEKGKSPQSSKKSERIEKKSIVFDLFKKRDSVEKKSEGELLGAAVSPKLSKLQKVKDTSSFSEKEIPERGVLTLQNVSDTFLREEINKYNDARPVMKESHDIERVDKKKISGTLEGKAEDSSSIEPLSPETIQKIKQSSEFLEYEINKYEDVHTVNRKPPTDNATSYPIQTPVVNVTETNKSLPDIAEKSVKDIFQEEPPKRILTTTVTKEEIENGKRVTKVTTEVITGTIQLEPEAFSDLSKLEEELNIKLNNIREQTTANKSTQESTEPQQNDSTANNVFASPNSEEERTIKNDSDSDKQTEVTLVKNGTDEPLHGAEHPREIIETTHLSQPNVSKLRNEKKGFFGFFKKGSEERDISQAGARHLSDNVTKVMNETGSFLNGEIENYHDVRPHTEDYSISTPTDQLKIQEKSSEKTESETKRGIFKFFKKSDSREREIKSREEKVIDSSSTKTLKHTDSLNKEPDERDVKNEILTNEESTLVNEVLLSSFSNPSKTSVPPVIKDRITITEKHFVKEGGYLSESFVVEKVDNMSVNEEKDVETSVSNIKKPANDIECVEKPISSDENLEKNGNEEIHIQLPAEILIDVDSTRNFLQEEVLRYHDVRVCSESVPKTKTKEKGGKILGLFAKKKSHNKDNETEIKDQKFKKDNKSPKKKKDMMKEAHEQTITKTSDSKDFSTGEINRCQDSEKRRGESKEESNSFFGLFSKKTKPQERTSNNESETVQSPSQEYLQNIRDSCEFLQIEIAKYHDVRPIREELHISEGIEEKNGLNISDSFERLIDNKFSETIKLSEEFPEKQKPTTKSESIFESQRTRIERDIFKLEKDIADVTEEVRQKLSEELVYAKKAIKVEKDEKKESIEQKMWTEDIKIDRGQETNLTFDIISTDSYKGQAAKSDQDNRVSSDGQTVETLNEEDIEPSTSGIEEQNTKEEIKIGLASTVQNVENAAKSTDSSEKEDEMNDKISKTDLPTNVKKYSETLHETASYVTSPSSTKRSLSTHFAKGERPRVLEVTYDSTLESSSDDSYIVTEPDENELNSMRKKPLFRLESEEDTSYAFSETEDTRVSISDAIAESKLECLLTDLTKNFLDADEPMRMKRSEENKRLEEHKRECQAEVEIIEKKLRDLDSALDSLEKVDLEIETKNEKKLRRVERKFERMASDILEKDTEEAKIAHMTSPEIEATRETEYRTLVSQLSTEDISDFQKDYNNLWDEHTFSKSSDWESKTPDSQVDVQELSQDVDGSTSGGTSKESAASSVKPEGEEGAEKDESGYERTVADQHQLSEEMKALLKELEKESKQ